MSTTPDENKYRKEVKAWLRGLKTYTINGKQVPRARFSPEESESPICSCGARPKSLHRPGCQKEGGVCQIHKFVVDCNCRYYPFIDV
jgi:hypothetical protein